MEKQTSEYSTIYRCGMQLNKKITSTFIFFFLICISARCQNIARWLVFPREQQPDFIMHPLSRSDRANIKLRFLYETEPVKPLIKQINKSFPEIHVSELAATQSYDIGKSTIILEELLKEADEILNQPGLNASSSVTMPETKQAK